MTTNKVSTNATKSAHYQLKLLQVSCASCVKHIEAALKTVQGIDDFQINFAARTVSITGSTEPQAAIKAIQAAGYNASLIENKQQDTGTDQAEMKHMRHLFYKALTAGIIGLALFILSWL